MSVDDMEFSLDDIIAEARGEKSPQEPEVILTPQPKVPEDAPQPEYMPEPERKPQRPPEDDFYSEEDESPSRRKPEPTEKRQRPVINVNAGAFVLIFALLLVFGLFYVHPGAVIPTYEPAPTPEPPVAVTPAPEATPEPVPSPETEPDNPEQPEATPEPVHDPKIHYSIPADAVVAPRPNPDNFGSVSVDNAGEVLNVIQAARDSGLLREDETVVFDPTVDFNRGSYYKDIVYYYDETLLVITWKQIIDGNTFTCVEVKMADASQFRRKITGDAYGSPQEYLSDLYMSSNAVVAMNADYYQFRDYGVMVYDGTLYKCTDKNYATYNGVDYKWYNCLDNCFVTRDGNFLFTYFGEEYTWEEMEQFIADNDISFSLSFGPILVDNYEVQSHYDGWYPVGEVNQGYSRAGIGQVDDLHYLYMSLNHSNEKEARWTMLQFAQLFQSRGVRCAYAFDGGQTSEVVFNGDIYNHVDKGSERWVSDMVYFGTALPEEVWNNG